MVAMGATRMNEPNFYLTPPGRAVMDRFEVARAEFVEALVCAVSRAIEDGKAEAEFACGHIDGLWCAIRVVGTERSVGRAFRRCAATAAYRAGSSG